MRPRRNLLAKKYIFSCKHQRKKFVHLFFHLNLIIFREFYLSLSEKKLCVYFFIKIQSSLETVQVSGTIRKPNKNVRFSNGGTHLKSGRLKCPDFECCRYWNVRFLDSHCTYKICYSDPPVHIVAKLYQNYFLLQVHGGLCTTKLSWKSDRIF